MAFLVFSSSNRWLMFSKSERKQMYLNSIMNWTELWMKKNIKIRISSGRTENKLLLTWGAKKWQSTERTLLKFESVAPDSISESIKFIWLKVIIKSKRFATEKMIRNSFYPKTQKQKQITKDFMTLKILSFLELPNILFCF